MYMHAIIKKTRNQDILLHVLCFKIEIFECDGRICLLDCGDPIFSYMCKHQFSTLSTYF